MPIPHREYSAQRARDREKAGHETTMAAIGFPAKRRHCLIICIPLEFLEAGPVLVSYA